MCAQVRLSTYLQAEGMRYRCVWVKAVLLTDLRNWRCGLWGIKKYNRSLTESKLPWCSRRAKGLLTRE